MIDALQASLRVAGSGLSAQSARLRVVSENLANAQSTGTTPGSDPYRRKTITFENTFDRVADDKGVVKMPNINMISEMSDMREANRSYEANLQVIKQSRDLISMTIDLLKGTS